MADTCIICLGDIQHVGGALNSDSKSPALEADETPAKVTIAPDGGGSELVATLLPCEHFLHDDCLKPWVERANSCPICRSAFNMVELRFAIGGPVESSYAVQDKRQVADIDPTLLIEEDAVDEAVEHEDPCMVCESPGNEGELLLCDGCNNTTHVFCAGLDSVPAGSWFCYTCQQDPQILARNYRTSAAGFNRRRRIRRPVREVGWERAWRSIFDRLHFDLDFPFDEEEDAGAAERSAATERREIREWRRRFDVAARQGAATRFRNTANILRHPDPPPQQSKPETQEETRLWNVAERARLIAEGAGENERPRSRGRKRKSRSNSPRESTPPPTERKLKRPRFSNRQRPQAAVDMLATNGESSSTAAIRVAAPAPQRTHQASPFNVAQANLAATNRTTFLQSLLSEVEAHPGVEGSEDDTFDDYNDAGSGPERSPSPHLSPAASPAASSHPTPRFMTPPPHSPIMRPVSPPPLASTISPIFPPAPDFSPFSPAVDEPATERARGRRQQCKQHASRHASSSPDHSPSHSPTRAPMSYEMKDQIKNMVAATLQPIYLRKEVDKENFTLINKSVSRMLYNRIWESGGLLDQASKERWQKVAAEEVKKAVQDAASNDTPETGTPPVVSGSDMKTATPTSQTTSELSIRPAVKV